MRSCDPVMVHRDRDHGASVVASRMLADLLDVATLDRGVHIVLAFVANHPELAALYPPLDLTVTAWSEGESDASWVERLRYYAVESERQARIAVGTAVSLISTLRPSQLAVLSHSGTVSNLFSALAQEGLRPQVLCAESRPRLEGRMTAAHAHALGYPVFLCADASIVSHLADGAMAVLGTDRLDRWFFRNKIGSHSLASSVAERGGWVLVPATPDKVVDDRVPWPKAKSQDPSEIWAESPPGLCVKNTYFEDVPIDARTVICHGGLTLPGTLWPKVCTFPVYHPATVRVLGHALSGRGRIEEMHGILRAVRTAASNAGLADY